MAYTRRRPTTLPLGTLAEATCKPEDWIDGLRWHLERMRLSKADRATVRQLLAEYDSTAVLDWDAETSAAEILDELISVAEGYLKPYTYLGTLEGDGACFGVWPSLDSLEEDVRAGEVWQPCARGDGYSIPGTIRLKVPRGAFVRVVSDHGNVTLYKGGREVWSVV